MNAPFDPTLLMSEKFAVGQPVVLGLRIRDQRLHHRQPAVVGQRSHLVVRVKSVADLDGCGLFAEGVGEAVIDRIGDEEACRRDADLPGVARFSDHRGRRGRDRIDIVADDHRRMSVEFHDGRLHMHTRHGGQMLTHRHRTGERHQPHRRLRNQILRDIRGFAEHEVQYPRRQAGTSPAISSAKSFTATADSASSRCCSFVAPTIGAVMADLVSNRRPARRVPAAGKRRREQGTRRAAAAMQPRSQSPP